jgi:hypothetical protein
MKVRDAYKDIIMDTFHPYPKPKNNYLCPKCKYFILDPLFTNQYLCSYHHIPLITKRFYLSTCIYYIEKESQYDSIKT